MKINLTFEGLSPEQANQLMGFLKINPAKVETATAVQSVAKVEKLADAAEQKSKYTIESIRKASKLAAQEKGKSFVKECLDGVGATCISNIDESRFDDFMNLLNGKK